MYPKRKQLNSSADLRHLRMINPQSDCIAIDSQTAQQSQGLSDPSIQFLFVCRRWTLGLVCLAFGMVCIGLGVALVAHTSSAPMVENQLLVCAAFMFGLGVYAAYKGTSELSSVLEIDARGITARTHFVEKQVPWNRLQSYSVRYSPDAPWESAIVVWIDDPELVFVEFSTHGLTETDHLLIRSAIGLYAPQHRARYGKL